ncbi:MAG: hydroxyacid dehydrogenase [Victivallales bacterium]|nr:hydroxyacid dehydrogenase [Victivallales bacterium]
MKKIKAAIIADNVAFYNGDIVQYVYGAKRIRTIRSWVDLYPIRINSENLEKELPNLNDIEVLFSCWGMPPVNERQLNAMPNLKAVFYAGGSVNAFAKPMLERGIVICNAALANAIPVAEFCLAQILLACKGAYSNSRHCSLGPWNQSNAPVGQGIYGETIALIGIGAISRYLVKLLKPFNLRIIAHSNYLTNNQEEMRFLRISGLVSIEEAFSQAYVISNHLADKPGNKKIITREHFASMRYGATFINTGRGAQVDEPGMIEVLKQRPDLTALLDVQYPEPPVENSELYSLPNVHMTSHIAGSINDEVGRMADFVLSDFLSYVNHEPLLNAINPHELPARA